MLSEKALKDLHRLGIERVCQAAKSVGQLLEDDEQTFDFLIALTASMAINAAELLHETVIKPDGTKPHRAECFAQVLTRMADRVGLESKVVSEEEAEKYGFTSKK